MKLSVYTILMPEFSLEEIGQFLSQTGYDGMELRVLEISPEQKKKGYCFAGDFKNDINPKNLREKVPLVKSVCDKYKIQVCGIGTYVKCFELDVIEELCRNLKTLGCRTFRVIMPPYPGDTRDRNQMFTDTVKTLADVEKLCKKYDTKFLLETHMNMIVASATATHRIISNFDPKYAGVIFDPGNMVFEGFENYKQGIQLLGKYLAHVHVKNYQWEVKETTPEGMKIWQPKPCLLWEGVANLKVFAEELKLSGYDGWVSCEDFYITGDNRKKLQDDFKFMNSVFNGK